MALIIVLIAVVHRSYWSAVVVAAGLTATTIAYDGTSALIGLKSNRAFQESLFSRKLMPFSFGTFDATEELDGLGRTMVGYDRRAR